MVGFWYPQGSPALGQFKPNEPLQFPTTLPSMSRDQKVARQKHFCQHWDATYQRILDDPTELVAITEGFKAASGITAGIPVALAGVWNGQVDKSALSQI